MKISPIAALLVFASLSALRADAPWSQAEHLLYVRVETEPAGATLSSIPAKEGAEPTVIGQTPLVIPVEMNWDRKYLRKKWELLHVATRGSIATNEYDRETKEQTVFLNFALEKDGFTRQVCQEVAGVFTYNERAEDWDHAINELPERRTIKVALVAEPAAVNGTAASAAQKSSKVPTVIMAGGKLEVQSLGYVMVEGPEGAPVYCDGVRAGKAPLRIMLPAGDHAVQTLRDGKATEAQPVRISAGKTESISLPAK